MKTETVSGMELGDVLESIKRETRPIDGHTDPGAIEDCWNEVFETLEANDTAEEATASSFRVNARVRCTVNGYFLDEKEPAEGETVLVDGFRRKQFVNGLGDFNTRVAGECRYCGNGKFIKGVNVEVKAIKWAPLPTIK